MRIGAMLGDITRSLFKRPVTELYPFERRPAPARLRGLLVFDPAKCTGCKICMRDCPAKALQLIVVDKATKRFAMKFHSDRCTYCAQCVVSCNFSSLSMSSDQWELAGLSPNGFEMTFGRDEDLAALRAHDAGSPPGSGA